jgi:hypothetical protein
VPRITVNVDEETEAWLEAEADRLNWSKADAGGWCINLMYSSVDHITPQQSDALGSDGREASDLRQRVDELEARVRQLETGVGGAETERTQRHRDESDTLPNLPDLPGTVDVDDAREAIEAAHTLLEERGRARSGEIVAAVMPDHPLGYDVDDALAKIEDESARYRGAWWRRVVKPGLEARETVEKPAGGRTHWRYTGDE